MSMEITEVHYDPDPKHIIIRSDTNVIDCANPVSPNDWLDGTYGETVCVHDDPYIHFEKALCELVNVYDQITLRLFKVDACTACGVLNAPMCCLNTTPINSFAVKDDADNCIPAP